MWVLSVSKRETALETKMRGIKMRTKKNKQYNVLLEKHQENSKNKGEVKGNDHKKWKNEQNDKVNWEGLVRGRLNIKFVLEIIKRFKDVIERSY